MKIGSVTIKREHPDILKGVVAGMVAGLFATYMKNRFQTLWTSVQEAETKPKPRSGTQTPGPKAEDPSTVKVANAFAQKVIHRDLKKKEKDLAGPAVDYGFGVLAGMAYGAMAEMSPAATVGGGTGFATALWAIGDELAVPASGLSKWPKDYPAKTHAYALSGHLVYGLAMELFRRVVRSSL